MAMADQGVEFRRKTERDSKAGEPMGSSRDVSETLQNLESKQEHLEAENEELRRNELKFMESQEEYSDLYECAPIGYFTLDQKSTILKANQTGATMLNIDPRILVKTPFTLFVVSKHRDRFREHLKKTMESKSIQSCELELRPRKKQAVFAHLQSIFIEPLGIITTVTDVTIQKNLEHELLATNEELEAFSYSVSHDLRAPLRALNGFSQMLLSDSEHLTDKERDDYLHRIGENAEKMNEIIDAILRLSRQTRKELQYEQVDLSELVKESVRQLQLEEPERQVKVSIGSCQAFGDREMLSTALNNLIRNAWKYTRKNPHPSITFGCQHTGDETIYFVKDNGVGFNMKYVDRLFKPFQRLHSNREFQGIGIGLSIVRRIINKHRGKIWAEGYPGKGAAFYFTLPRLNNP